MTELTNEQNQNSSITMKAPRGRFSPVDHVNPYSLRPWMFPQPGEIVELIDSFDKLQTIVGDVKLPWWTRLRLWLADLFSRWSA